MILTRQLVLLTASTTLILISLLLLLALPPAYGASASVSRPGTSGSTSGSAYGAVQRPGSLTPPPVTSPPTTTPPTTGAPVTAPPTTGAPITSPPTTGAPVTAPPTTGAPVTALPTTRAPTTGAPVTAQPTTTAPTNTTTDAPTAKPKSLLGSFFFRTKEAYMPTKSPTDAPTISPTEPPTTAPTTEPSQGPTFLPTSFVADAKKSIFDYLTAFGKKKEAQDAATNSTNTTSPSDAPSIELSEAPTEGLSEAPSVGLTETESPTAALTESPTYSFRTKEAYMPTRSPTTEPLTTAAPTAALSESPSIELSEAPTIDMSEAPTIDMSDAPTVFPTEFPTVVPTSAAPTDAPSGPPTVTPTVDPTREPTETPTGSPTTAPTDTPTSSPSDEPTRSPTDLPTKSPTADPTSGPTNRPSTSPTDSPTSAPTTLSPTVASDHPSMSPTTAEPTKAPSAGPTRSPSDVPSPSPTSRPTKAPTANPTEGPTTTPTDSPTKAPTGSPTQTPTAGPTNSPTKTPTGTPTQAPTAGPTKSPSDEPTISPTELPTDSPTANPTNSPTKTPTSTPTQAPTAGPTKSPSDGPTISPTDIPTSSPTDNPTSNPTDKPTSSPTGSPTSAPTTLSPTVASEHPSLSPTTTEPTEAPTPGPTKSPSDEPTISPTELPTNSPTAHPTDGPTQTPTESPTADPTGSPSYKPSVSPTEPPTALPTIASGHPSSSPTTVEPTMAPTEEPTRNPTDAPTGSPTKDPTAHPTSNPTIEPTIPPTTNSPTIASGHPSLSPTTEVPMEATTSEPTSPPTNDPTASTPQPVSVKRSCPPKPSTSLPKRPDHKPVVLHTEDQPKLRYYNGIDVAHITTYQEAQDFCADKGRVLASRFEWCQNWYDDPNVVNIYGGYQDEEEWVPIRTQRGERYPDVNEWLQVGHHEASQKDAIDSVCKTYKELHGLNDTDELVVLPPEEERTQEGRYCEKPAGCTGNTCVFWCNETEGYYPDANDCRSYCYCSGESGKPSFWQQVEGEGLVWDPFCGGSEPLDDTNVPLGGMTGGCPNHDWAVDDTHYCMSEEVDKKYKRRNFNSSEISSLSPSNQQPMWGLKEDKQESESNAILCTRLPRSPSLPGTCASLWGHQHVLTFDGTKYECQGAGEFILSKSLDSTFQLQARLQRFSLNSPGTVATAAVLDTGLDCEPKVEVRFPPGECRLEYLIDGVKMDLDYNWVREGTRATKTDAVHFFVKRDDRYFYFPNSGISFHIRKKHSDDMGSYMNIRLCLPDHMKSERLVGMLGTPNGNKKDEFMNALGERIKVLGNLHFRAAHEYCVSNWCIGENPDSLFEAPVVSSCDEPYNQKLQMDVLSSSPELYAVCEGDIPCLIEGAAGDMSDAIDSVTEQRILRQPEVAPEQTNDDNDSLEQNDIFCLTEATGAEETPKENAYTKGDPHFRTFGGERFDFHGGCDLVLLHNPSFHHGTGMDIHVRTKIKTWWSYVQAAAVRIGPQFLEVRGGANRTEWFWVNRQVNRPLVKGEWHLTHIAGYKVRYKETDGVSREVHIYLGEKETVTLKTYRDFVRVDMDLEDPRHYIGAFGILGRYPDGARLGRDRITEILNPNEYGQEWQVLEREPRLFHTYEGVPVAPQQCEMPTAQTTSLRRRRLAESQVSQEDAENACAHLDNPIDRKACVSDVLATEDLSMAEAFCG